MGYGAQTQCGALLTDTGLGRWHSVLPSNLGVTEVGCSELRKTWGSFSASELSHPQSHKAEQPGVETGNSNACLGQRKDVKF